MLQLGALIRPRRSSNAAVYSCQTFPWTICRSVGAYIRRSVCPVHCGKTADRIRVPFGIIGRTVPGMRQVVRYGDRSTGTGTFESELGVRHCNQWALYGIRVRECRDAAPFPNYFWQTCYQFPVNHWFFDTRIYGVYGYDTYLCDDFQRIPSCRLDCVVPVSLVDEIATRSLVYVCCNSWIPLTHGHAAFPRVDFHLDPTVERSVG